MILLPNEKNMQQALLEIDDQNETSSAPNSTYSYGDTTNDGETATRFANVITFVLLAIDGAGLVLNVVVFFVLLLVLMITRLYCYF